MKKWLMGVLVMIAGLANAQADVAPKVNEAIKNADAVALARLMQNQVEISIDDFEGAVSKEEAQKKLTQFFSAHKVNSYSPKHNGTSKLGDQYYIGEMKSGATMYRVTVFVKKTKDGTRVSQLRIEES
jgi:N-acetylglucosamine kinase-like BadF-type ATPase